MLTDVIITTKVSEIFVEKSLTRLTCIVEKSRRVCSATLQNNGEQFCITRMKTQHTGV